MGTFAGGAFEGEPFLEGGEELEVYKVVEGIAGDAFGVCGPVAPAEIFREGGGVVILEEFDLFFPVVVDF